MVPLSPVKAGFAFAIVALLLACAPSVQRAPISTSISGDDSVDPSSPVGGSPGLGDDQDADPADAGLTSSGDDDAQADIDSTPGDDQAENDAFPIEGEAAVPEADPGPPFDAGEGGICPSGVGPGDLTVTELMIASMAGTGDHGEWLEVASTRDCALNVRGLHGEVPSGTKVRVVDVDDDSLDSSTGNVRHCRLHGSGAIPLSAGHRHRLGRAAGRRPSKQGGHHHIFGGRSARCFADLPRPHPDHRIVARVPRRLRSQPLVGLDRLAILYGVMVSRLLRNTQRPKHGYSLRTVAPRAPSNEPATS